MNQSYYTVLGSLPHLPHFQQAERLPLTRLRLEQRIGMLPDDESRQIWEAEALVSLRHAVSRRPDDDAWLRRWRRAMPVIRRPALREYVRFRLDQQVALAALAREDALTLERHLLESCWCWLERRAAAEPLGFAAVVAFVFQWDIVNAWLTQDTRRAAVCFERLLQESRHVR